MEELGSEGYPLPGRTCRLKFLHHPARARREAHSSPRTTKLYDGTNDELTLDEIERIQI
jgi:hypothetical protein